MSRIIILYIFICVFYFKSFSAGFNIKTSSVIDQPGIEVLGNYNSSWYVIGFEKPSRLNEPVRYQIFKYATGFVSAKTSPIYPSFGEKTIYLQSAFINNKISMFYGKCEKRVEVEALDDNHEGHRLIPVILCQDYDPGTLEPLGNARVIFKSDAESFAASGIEIAESEDHSKTAVLIKGYYTQQQYKIILTDNQNGQIYAKIFDLKAIKEPLNFLQLKVSNDGGVVISAKIRDDIIANPSGGKQNGYYFFSIDKNGNEPALLSRLSAGKEKYTGEPLINFLNTGEIMMAYNFSQDGKSALVKGISVSKYDVNFKLIAEKEIIPNNELISLAAAYSDSKKENGLPYLELQQILPLQGGNLAIIAEYQRTIENQDKTKVRLVERNYLITYRLNENLEVGDFHFVPKKQVSNSVEYAFSAQAYSRGNDVFLFHNDDWQSDQEHGMDLQCTCLPANGTEQETQKIIHTSEDFFTSMKHCYPATDGKLLFTEEKIVDYENVSREVKLLEITLK